ncbi:MAG: AsmA family protein, partial [Gemmatimonadales bacterium]
MKRALAILGTLLAVLLVLLLVLPLLFRDQIDRRVKLAVNQSVAAQVNWRKAGIGFFRNFPNATLRLDDLTVVNAGRFQGDTLAAIRHLGVVLDLASVLRNVVGGSGPIVVRGVELDQPRLRLIALEDGTANWDISRESGVGSRESKAMEISLRSVNIKNADIAFDNR